MAMDFEAELLAVSTERATRRAAIKKYPTLSVVIATARPSDLSNILLQLEVQTMKKFELLLGIHKFKMSAAHKSAIRRLQKRGISIITQDFSPAHTLGSVLTSMAKQSSGEYLAKMDDDDIYGPEHLRDLMDAAITTGADVVGKAMNYIYLEAIDLTVRRMGPTGIASVNQWDDWVCGGTILVKRSKAEAAGWFGEGKSAVDHFLLSGVKKNGGKIYRTFGLGYIYKRSIASQTYITNYSKYMRGTSGQRVGIWAHEEFGNI
jgi:hypothetical protein